MLFKTITKFFVFVILLLIACGFGAACSGSSGEVPRGDGKQLLSNVTKIGSLDSPEVKESSGLAASKCFDDVLWTHNDSGNSAHIFAITPGGVLIGKWLVKNAKNRDWESITSFRDTSDKCFLYIADIGNNSRQRGTSEIYRIPEPDVSENVDATQPAQKLTFDYEDGNYDAETILVHPFSGDIYIITKSMNSPAGVYKIAAPVFNGGSYTALKVAEIKLPSIPHGAVTGGDISPDGQQIVLVDYLGGYLLTLPQNETDFEKIWLQRPVQFDAGDRKQGESATFSLDGDAIFTTSEGVRSPIYKITLRDK